MKQAPFRWVVLLTIMVVAVLVLAACAEEEEETTTENAATEEVVAATEEAVAATEEAAVAATEEAAVATEEAVAATEEAAVAATEEAAVAATEEAAVAATEEAAVAATEEAAVAATEEAAVAATEEAAVAATEEAAVAATEEAAVAATEVVEVAMATEEAAVAATEEAATDAPQTIAEIAMGNEDFSTLVAAVVQAELAETLMAEGPFTVFAPTNSAFEALPPGMLEGVMSSPPSLEAVLLTHVVEGKLTAEDIAAMDGETLTTLSGIPLSVEVDGDTIILNGTVKIVTADVEAANGIVHIIDSVIVPARPGSEPEAAATEEAAMEATEAPMAATEEAAADAGAMTLADVAKANEDLTTLGTALNLADDKTIVEALAGEDPITVFAPSNDAFTATLTRLKLSVVDVAGRPDLVSVILRSHVVAGTLTAADLAEMDGEELETVEGEKLLVEVDGDTIKIGGATVVTADLAGSNGVIHVIDNVIVPQSVIDALAAPAATATPKP